MFLVLCAIVEKFSVGINSVRMGAACPGGRCITMAPWRCRVCPVRSLLSSSQHKMPKERNAQSPTCWAVFLLKSHFPPTGERQGLRPAAEDCACSWGEFLWKCESLTRDFLRWRPGDD